MPNFFEENFMSSLEKEPVTPAPYDKAPDQSLEKSILIHHFWTLRGVLVKRMGVILNLKKMGH